jgi:glucosyl-dolichyl phosphate glucuronosyltransferase
MISVLICTYNRPEILSFCLDSFVRQSADPDLFEVIVVDNNSTDHTRRVVESFSGKIRHLRYVLEEQVGLSHARNRGFREARFDWVSYVDDDAKAHSDFVERAIWVIHTFRFDFFGGRYLPWFNETVKPSWLPKEVIESPVFLGEPGVLAKGKHVPGGVMVAKKELLVKVGGFPAQLGMAGESVGYGEENWVQDELRKQGYTVGFDPDLKIDHLVAPYKFTLRWHFKRQYAKGRAARILNNKKYNPLWMVIKACLITGKHSVINFFRLFRKDYYWQNYMLDTFGFLVRTIGFVSK